MVPVAGRGPASRYTATGAQFKYIDALVYLRNPGQYASEVASFGDSVQLWSAGLVVTLGVTASTSGSGYTQYATVYDRSTHTVIASNPNAEFCDSNEDVRNHPLRHFDAESGHGRRLQQRAPDHLQRPHLVAVVVVGWLALSGLAALVVLAGYSRLTSSLTAMVGGWHWPTAAFALLDGATAVVLAVWTVSWFQNRWNGPPRRVTAAAGRASYAAYFLHPLVLVGLSIAIRGLPWPPEVKFLIVAAVGVPASFAVGHLATRTPGVNRIV